MSLPKCTQCAGLLGKDTFTHDLAYKSDDEIFCSQTCAEKHYDMCMSIDLDESEGSDE